MAPNSSGVIALVEDTAVVEIQKALAKADKIVTKAVDKQVAAEIDRDAAAAKASLDYSTRRRDRGGPTTWRPRPTSPSPSGARSRRA